MATEVEERLRDLKLANEEVQEESEHEKMMFADACRRIEQEKVAFLQGLRDDYEAENSDQMSSLTALEAEISRYSMDLAALKDHIQHCKVDVAARMQAVAERTAADEQGIYAEIEGEVNQEIQILNREAEELKEAEKESRKKLHIANSKLEETRANATRVLASFRNQLSEYRNQLRDAITEEKTLENQFTKREQQYNSFYETVEKEEKDIKLLTLKLDKELQELMEQHQREAAQIEEHYEGGKSRLDKILYAINEFKQENEKQREKNERTLGNLKMGLDDLIKGIVPQD